MEFKGMLRRVAGVGAAVAAMGAMLMAPGSAGAAQDGVAAAPKLVKILHASARTCLDSNDLGHVYTLGCPDEKPISNNQKWDNSTPGKYKNYATGMCLAASNGGTAYTTKECTDPVTTWKTDGTSPTYIRHVQKAGWCLNGAGGSPQGVGIVGCSAATRWSILATS